MSRAGLCHGTAGMVSRSLSLSLSPRAGADNRMLGRPAGRTRRSPRRRCCPGKWPSSSPLSSSPPMDQAMTEMRSVTARAGTTRVDTLTTPVSTRLNCCSALTFPVSMYRRRCARHVFVCLVYELLVTIVLLRVPTCIEMT